jgi:hypothetical protein
MHHLLATTAIAATFVAAPAFAQSTVVAPDGFATTDGSAISDGPIDDAGDRFQQVYAGSFFDEAVTITEIQFRAANSENSFRPNSITASDVTITLSTTGSLASAAGIAGAYDTNVGSDVTTVFDGPITLDRGGSNPSGSPQPFEYGFVLETPFDFDPSMGNLLLDVSVPGSATITLGSGFGALESFDAVVDQPDLDGIASKTGEFGANSTGLVTQFTTRPIPEPATAGLLGVVALAMLRRRR